MADLNGIEQIQANLELIQQGNYPSQYFEDFLFKMVDFAKNQMLEGSGSPEGVVTAPKRSRYTDLTGLQAYYKTTTTGNTGWITV